MGNRVARYSYKIERSNLPSLPTIRLPYILGLVAAYEQSRRGVAVGGALAPCRALFRLLRRWREEISYGALCSQAMLVQKLYRGVAEKGGCSFDRLHTNLICCFGFCASRAAAKLAHRSLFACWNQGRAAPYWTTAVESWNDVWKWKFGDIDIGSTVICI